MQDGSGISQNINLLSWVLLDTEGTCLEGHIVGDQNQITAPGILRGLHAHLPRQHANVIAALRALRPETMIYQHPIMIRGKQDFIFISVLRIICVGFNSTILNSA